MKRRTPSLSSSARRLLFLALLCFTLPARSADAQDPGAEQELYLEVTVNQAKVPGLVHVRHAGGIFRLEPEDAARLGLNPDSLPQREGWLQLAPGPGLALDYDELNQTLSVTADISELRRRQLIDSRDAALRLTQRDLAPPLRGMALGYDIYTMHTGGRSNFSAATQFRSFGLGAGVLTASFNTRYQAEDIGLKNGTQRLETGWRSDNPDTLRTLIVGDSFTSALSWNRSVRFGGISLSHNLALQPDVPTTAQASYAGSATLPSTVDLYVNGMRTSTQSVQPGQFVLNTTPTFSGTGTAELVITDINGVQRRVSLNLYGAPTLLAKGLESWALNAGWMRRGYARRSFSYAADPLFVGSWRRGISNTLTLEAHTEQSIGLANAGLGAYWLPSPSAGVLNASASASRHEGRAGQQLTAGYQWNSRTFNFSVGHHVSSAGYADVARLDEYALATRRSTNLWLGRTLASLGSVGLGYVAQRYEAGGNERYLSLTWSRTLPREASLSLSVTRTQGSLADGTSFFVNLSVPLSRRARASAQLTGGPDNRNQRWQVSRPLDQDQGGWGWNLAQQYGDVPLTHAELSWMNRLGEVALGVNRYAAESSYYGRAVGSVAVLDGNAYAMRRLDDAFAVVDTAGVPGVPVLLQNRPMGLTDSRGLLLLTQLNSYQRNKIAIDPLTFPMDYRTPETEQYIVPRYGSGTRVGFGIYRVRALLLRVKDASGQPVEMGAAVRIGGAGQAGETAATVVGHDGEIYLENPPAGGTLHIRGKAAACSAAIPDFGAAEDAIVQREAICH